MQLEPKKVDLQEILFSDMRQIPDDASIASSDNESLVDESDLSLWVGNPFFFLNLILIFFYILESHKLRRSESNHETILYHVVKVDLKSLQV